MFGWEFPPHILGGLGTASYGLTKGMAAQGDMDITFVIPRPSGDEDTSFLRIIGAGDTPVVWRDVSYDYVRERLAGKMTPELYYQLRDHIYADFSHYRTNDLGCFEFSGKYLDNLLEEINNYSIVAGVIARSEGYDVIHSHDWLTYPAGIHAKQITGKPLVVHVHATDFDRSRGNVNPTVFGIEMDGMNHADHIITVSELTRRTVIEKYHQDPAKVTTVHNAVTPLSPAILALPDKRGVKDKVVTFLGRITMQKGCEYFVEAAAKVLERRLRHALGLRALRDLPAGGHAVRRPLHYLLSVGLRRDPRLRHQGRLLGHRRYGRRHLCPHYLPRDARLPQGGGAARGEQYHLGGRWAQGARHLRPLRTLNSDTRYTLEL